MNKIVSVTLFCLLITFVFIMGAFFAWSTDAQEIACNIDIIPRLCDKYAWHMLIELALGIGGAIASWFIAGAGIKK